jgi:hypothetical protein
MLVTAAKLVSLLTTLLVVSAAHGKDFRSRRHAKDNFKVERSNSTEQVELEKRQSGTFSGRGTFYYTEVGLGACGEWDGRQDECDTDQCAFFSSPPRCFSHLFTIFSYQANNHTTLSTP